MGEREANLAKETAQWVLLEHGCTELPVKTYPICERMGISSKLYYSADDNMRNRKPYIFTRKRSSAKIGGGYCTILKGKPYSFVDNRRCIEYQRFTVAHELGHIMHGHVGAWQWVSEDGVLHVVTDRTIPCGEMEQEADAFASELLMPECVLMLCGVETAEEIAVLCKTLPEDAEPVAERIRQRRQKGESFTPMEQRIVQRFLEYIQRTCAVTCRREGRE